MKLRLWRPAGGWLRFLVRWFLRGLAGLVLLVVIGWYVVRQPWAISRVIPTLVRSSIAPVLEEPKASIASEAVAGRLSGELTGSGGTDFFRFTNIWPAHFRFTTNEWAALGPRMIPPVARLFQAGGQMALRNPAARRPGIAGSMGIDLPWSTGTLVLAGREITNAAVRFKGNGTFLDALKTHRRSFKVDLNEHVKGRSVAGLKMLNFGNMGGEASGMSEVLGYALHRDAGVPASRTAYARVTLTLEGRFEDRLLGMYAVVEDIDARWVEDRFGKKGAVVFKPVTYDLFQELGDAWSAYEPIYDPKTALTDADRERVMAFCRWFTRTGEAEFAQGIGDFLDLDEFARFLACQALIVNYDGLIGTGQNFLVYLETGSRRFGFAPWDLDQAWGRIGFAGTAEQRVRASIWHPWMGRNSFLERMFRVDAFRDRYRAALESILTQWFQPERLDLQIALLSERIRPLIEEESEAKAARHDVALSDAPRGGEKGMREGAEFGGVGLRRFIRERAASVRAQLDGLESGEIIQMKTFW